MTDQDKPSEPAKVPTVGELVRDLRQGAGLTRRIFGEQTKLGELMIKSVETGRIKLTVEQRQRILRHPAMRDLAALASTAGLKMP